MISNLGSATNAIPLVCDQGLRQAPGAPCNPAPTFPLTVLADPSHPDLRVQTGQNLGGNGAPLTITAASAVAHYGTDRKSVSSDSALGSVDLAGTGATSAAALSFRRQAALVLRGPVAAASVKPSTCSTGSSPPPRRATPRMLRTVLPCTRYSPPTEPLLAWMAF